MPHKLLIAVYLVLRHAGRRMYEVSSREKCGPVSGYRMSPLIQFPRRHSSNFREIWSKTDIDRSTGKCKCTWWRRCCPRTSRSWRHPAASNGDQLNTTEVHLNHPGAIQHERLNFTVKIDAAQSLITFRSTPICYCYIVSKLVQWAPKTKFIGPIISLNKLNLYRTYLEGERSDGIIHDFGEAKSQHEDHQQLSVHGTERHPQMGAGTRHHPSKKRIKGLVC